MPEPGIALSTETTVRLSSAIAASRAPATRRAYSIAWSAWTAWAAAHSVAPMPAHPQDVAAYLVHRSGTVRMATLRMTCAAVAAAHDDAGHRNPCADPIIKAAMRGFARQAAAAGAATGQACGLTAEAVAVIRESLGRIDTAAGALSMAIVSITSDAGLRRSECAALEWRDMERQPDGTGRLTIRKSKTDQKGAGAVVAITAAAVADLDRLAATRRGSVRQADKIFPINGQSIGRRIAGAAKAAGLGLGYSGHSGRVGLAQRMTRNGAPAAAVMRQGRWETTRMLAKYTRNETAAEALRYL